MEEELKLGIPDAEKTGAPLKRFHLGEKQVRLISRLFGPATMLALGAFAAKLVAGDVSERSQHADTDDNVRSVKAEERGPSRDLPAQIRHEASAPHHATAQVVSLHTLRAWRSPDAASIDLTDFSPHHIDAKMNFHSILHYEQPTTALDPILPISVPANDAPFAFASAASQPEAAQVESSPEQPPKLPATPNSKPTVTGPVALGRGFRNESMLITALILLAGASDADDDTLSISDLSCTGGTLTSYGSDVWLFTPDHDLTGPIDIEYSISDGTDRISQTARLNLIVPPGQQIEGTPGNDVLVGTPLADVMSAGDGDDIIYGREGADAIDGGNGNDRIIGGDGNDILYGGAGNDLIFGGAGDDNIFGGTGSDFIDAGDGNDFADGGDGNDTIDGGAGSDLLFGGAGDDQISGGDGADVIDPGAGTDTVDAGAGDDRIILYVLDENDTIDGGAGSDTIDLSAIHTALVVNLAIGSIVAVGDDTSVALISSIENVVGGSGDDVITADAHVNVLVGGDGNDRFVFLDIEPLQNGGSGSDVICDFQAGDRIDLSEISNKMNEYAAVKLFFAGYGSDGPHLGAVWYVFADDTDGERTIISSHVSLSDEQQDEDFSIKLYGHQSVTSENFIFEYHALVASISA